jgi:hypothetical protein
VTIADDRAAPPGGIPGEPVRVEPLGPGWLTVTVVVGIMAALIALGGMVLSFRAVSHEMIPAFGARWAWLVPVVVDLTVFVFSGVDLVLARLDMNHPLARITVYVATAGTVYLNYSAGGTTAGRVAHVLMPSIWVVFIELMRHVVRRQVNLATASHREAIPAARWLLSPWPTLKLWRRMVLWRVHSYPAALMQEKGRLGAVATAREMHGRLWRWRISPLTRLQINLGELDAAGLRPAAVPTVAPAPVVASVQPEEQPVPSVVPVVPVPPIQSAQPVQPVRAPEPAPAPPLDTMVPTDIAARLDSVARPGGAHAAAPTPYVLPSQRGPLPAAPTFQAPPPTPREAEEPPGAVPPGVGRESELLVAAREVDRWRGQPSANRIGRELGVGPKLAAALADALRAEDERSYR